MHVFCQLRESGKDVPSDPSFYISFFFNRNKGALKKMAASNENIRNQKKVFMSEKKNFKQ